MEPLTDADFDREPLDPDEERAKLHAFLRHFEMQPDVRSAIEHEFWRRKGLYKAIVDKVSAYDRLIANIAYADAHHGNVVVEVKGRKRHGKSTWARWYCRLRQRLRTGRSEGWEDKVLYEKAYSGTTMEVMHLAERLRGESDTDVEVIAKLHGYIIVLDEALIEHEKDSVKAKHDLQNLIGSCGVAQIDFLFLSVEARGIYPDFTIWVVGVDSRRHLTLSFYYSSDGECYGCLFTPDVPETEKYQAAKASVVVTTLIHGGRAPAEVKAVNGTPAEAAPITIVVPPNADFMTVLEASARLHLIPILKDAHLVDRWLQRYFRGLTYKDIAELEGTGVKADSVGIFLREQQTRIPNTLLGAILEEALVAYLNQTIPYPSHDGTLGADAPPLQQTFHRRGGPGQPDVTATSGIQVNCKLFLEHRSSWQLHCSPEHTSPHGYCVLAELGPPGPTLHVYPLAPDHELLDTGSVEEVAWSAWIEQLRGLVAAP